MSMIIFPLFFGDMTIVMAMSYHNIYILYILLRNKNTGTHYLPLHLCYTNIFTGLQYYTFVINGTHVLCAVLRSVIFVAL